MAVDLQRSSAPAKVCYSCSGAGDDLLDIEFHESALPPIRLYICRRCRSLAADPGRRKVPKHMRPQARGFGWSPGLWVRLVSADAEFLLPNDSGPGPSAK